MRSHLLTRFAAGGAIVVLSVLGGGTTVLAEQGKSAEHRNDASAHETHEANGADDSVELTEPQPASNADFTGSGANEHGPYDSTRDGSPSDNGVGDGAATGEPCAGCVGQADNKNPPGQLPDATDPNQGYECDGNQGIARSNPAHTGCVEGTTIVEEGNTLIVETTAATPANVLGVSFTAVPESATASPPVAPAAVLASHAVAPTALAATGPTQDVGGLAMAGAVLVLIGGALRLTSRRRQASSFGTA